MFLQSNVHLKDLADFLQKNFREYNFNTDSSLNLIEIIKKKNAKKGKCENENVLAVGEDGKARLIFFEHNSKILDIEKQAQEFMLKVSGEQRTKGARIHDNNKQKQLRKEN